MTADYVFGKTLQADATAEIVANGGKVLGAVYAPLNTADFSSFILQAQSSKAKVIALANAGGDTQNAIKQAHEFGLVASGQKIAPLLFAAVNVHAIGLDIAQRAQDADSDEAGHAFQFEAGHLFRSEAGHHSDLKPATQRSLPRIEPIMFRRGEQVKRARLRAVKGGRVAVGKVGVARPP